MEAQNQLALVEQQIETNTTVLNLLENRFGTGQIRSVDILTTLTTFGGLTPIILETSTQATRLIPMAISLGFGIVFATSIILVTVPCLYMIMEDVIAFVQTG